MSMNHESECEIDGQYFHIRSMTGLEQMQFHHGCTEFADVPPERFYQLAKACITGWRDGKNLRGEPMPYTPENVEYLPAAVVMELATEIMLLSQPSEDAKKTLPASQ